MSGICAVLRLDGRAAASSDCAPILAALAARGPDGSAAAQDGSAALGHALNATTPEAQTEPMPLRHGPTGCLITADARIDNRDDLMAALGIATADRVVGDGAIIMAAYLRWGPACPGRLLGDFAFVIWDPRHRRLFAARDKVGMRQLTYHFAPGRLFACATDPHALIAHPHVPRRVNETRIADFIDQLEAADHVSTFFADVHRLPPANALTIEDGALRVWRYWRLEPVPVITRASNAAYEEAFRDVLTLAVRDRLRAPGNLGAMLSGGMDSGSVAALAAGALHAAGAPPLRTFSAIDSDPACPESACIRDSAAHIPHLAPQFVSIDEAESFRDDIIRLTLTEGDPFDGHMAVVRAVYRAARRSGVRVMLDGVSGDTTLGTGDMVRHHIAQGRIAKAWAEARAQERMWGDEMKATRCFATAIRQPFIPQWVHRLRRPGKERALAARQAADSIIAPALAERVDMAARRRANGLHLEIGRDCSPASQSRRPLHPYAIVGRERYDRVAAEAGIEPRDPYMDMRVIEFCLGLPVEQLQDDGWPKMIQRRAMAGLLPDSVRWKRGRDHVGWRFAAACSPGGLDTADEVVRADLARYASFATNGAGSALHRNIGRVVSESDLSYLASWLTHFKLPRG